MNQKVKNTKFPYPMNIQLHKFKKIAINAKNTIFLALVLAIVIVITLILMWHNSTINEIYKFRIVLDDTSHSIRLEAINQNGKTHDFLREKWGDNPTQQKSVLRKLHEHAEQKITNTPIKYIVRVGENDTVMHVDNILMKPLLDYGLNRNQCTFEIISLSGKIRLFTGRSFMGCGDTSVVFIGIYDHKNISSLLHAKLEPVRLTNSTEWGAYLKERGVSHVATLLSRSSNTNNINECIIFTLGISSYNRMIDLCDAYSKLTDIGIPYNNIFYAETKRKLFVDGEGVEKGIEVKPTH